MPRRSSKAESPLLGIEPGPQQDAINAPFGPELELWAGDAIVIGIDEAGR